MERNVREMLENTEDFLSGEQMSEALGITRAAVWKQVEKLRKQGYTIEAVTNRGYRMTGRPPILNRERIQSLLPDCPWRDTLRVMDTVSSTNDLARTEALQGAPEGSCYLSDEQTGGRGRQGRNFVSLKGSGIYLSVLLRPRCSPGEVIHVTAMAAVAACDAVEEVSGVRPGIKWTNDLILNGRKIGGILTELSAEWESGALESLVIGIGINCCQQEEDFPEDIRQKAASLRMALGHSVDRDQLAAALIRALFRLSQDLLQNREAWMERYTRDCITIGRQVKILTRDAYRTGVATGISRDGALLVHYDDTGEDGVVMAGDVSVRGPDGYL